MFKTKKDLPVTASGEDRYTSGEVARIAGVSLRQLQWWDERNVVSPRQEGHRRVYLPQEVVEVSVIAELRRKGFSSRRFAGFCGSCKGKWGSGSAMRSRRTATSI